MPTITFSRHDLCKLVGKKLNDEQLSSLLEKAKAEIAAVEGDEVIIKLNDTNLPCLWTVEGLAVYFRCLLGMEKGIPRLKLEKSNYTINVESSVKRVRPFIAAFIAKGKPVEEAFLKQLIQMQEKLCDNYGRKRSTASVGIYPSAKIHFPVTYTTADPRKTSFVPLEHRSEANLARILNEHPKGREYGRLLEGLSRYPILLSANREVLSFPPIINSAQFGKVSIGDTEMMVETTGTDERAVMLITNIFALALSRRGFKICPVRIKSGRSHQTPDLSTEKIRIDFNEVNKLLGLSLSPKEITSLLQKSMYGVKGNTVETPWFRDDVMHAVDVAEDIAIAYDYARITGANTKSHGPGALLSITQFCDKIRIIATGFGFEELFLPVLSSKTTLYDRMNIKDFDTVEISEYVSETYSCVRTWLLPGLVETLSRNRHVDYPQKIFEQGKVTVRKGDDTMDYDRIALASAHYRADFTEMKQCLDFIARLCGFGYELVEEEHDSFIPGRTGRIVVKGVKVGYIGDIHPKVLNNWGIETPVAAMELNLTELLSALGG